ncbi:MAG: alpha/beta hydrolase [Isosphaeraceae bacterium]
MSLLPGISLVPVLLLQKTGTRLVIGLLSFLTGLLACILLAIVEFGAWALIVPGRGRTADAKSDEHHASGEEGGPEIRPIQAVGSDGTKLAGRWHPAADRDGGGTVLLLHGFAEPSSSLQPQRTLALVRNNWNVAALDLRGYGRSDGMFASFGGREAADVRAWIDSLENQPGLSGPLFPVLWGRSMGAAIALRAAAEDPRIRALVLESPMVDLNEAMAVWFRKRHFPFPKLLARLVTRRAGRLAGVPLSRPAPSELAPRVRCPVLIAHGGDDRLVSTESVRRLARAFARPPAVFEVPGAGHADVIALGGEPILDQIVRFLQGVVAAGDDHTRTC